MSSCTDYAGEMRRNGAKLRCGRENRVGDGQGVMQVRSRIWRAYTLWEFLEQGVMMIEGRAVGGRCDVFMDFLGGLLCLTRHKSVTILWNSIRLMFELVSSRCDFTFFGQCSLSL